MQLFWIKMKNLESVLKFEYVPLDTLAKTNYFSFYYDYWILHHKSVLPGASTRREPSQICTFCSIQNIIFQENLEFQVKQNKM